MNKSLRSSMVVIGVLFLASCADEKVAGPTQEQGVMAAQYAARQPDGRPLMLGVEADKIYEDYIDSIGKPLKNSNNESQVRRQ